MIASRMLRARGFLSAGRVALSNTRRTTSMLAPRRGFAAGISQANQLIQRASEGNLDSLRELVESGVSPDSADYDLRHALHLSSAEGHVDIVNFLLDQGADVNAVDRFGQTPLNDAITQKHRDVITLLVERGGKSHTSLVSSFNQAASKDDIEAMECLLLAGAQVNEADSDGRMPLHAAADTHKVKAVEWLLAQGADVNPRDRFGNTPLALAKRGRGRAPTATSKVLREEGGIVADGAGFQGPRFQSSLQHSMPILAERTGYDYVEVWIPSHDNTELVQTEWYASKKLTSQAQELRLNMNKHVHASDKTSVTECFHSAAPVINEKPCGTASAAALGDRFEEAVATNVKQCLTLPVIHNGVVMAVFDMYSWNDDCSNVALDPQEVAQHDTFLDNLVAAGVFDLQPELLPTFSENDHGLNSQMQEVYQHIVAEGVYNANTIYNTVDWFYNHLGLQSDYFNSHSPRLLANHIHSFIAALKLAKTTGDPERVWLQIENNPKLLGPGGPEQSLHIVPDVHRTKLAVERNIERRIKLVGDSKPFSVKVFQSKKPFIRGGTKKLMVYCLYTSKYSVPEAVGTNATNIWDVASDTFISTKSKEVRQRYQDLIKEASERISPVVRIYPEHRSGTTPLMIAFKSGAGTATSYQIQLTEMLEQNKLVSRRKFIETFANGVVVYSVYVAPDPNVPKADFETRLQELIHDFSLLHLVPHSHLTPQFLAGTNTAEEYTYMSAAQRFIFYFVNQISEEYEALKEAVSGDALNMSRLQTLFNTLKREAVSKSRLSQTMLAHPKLMAQIFADFEKRINTKGPCDPVIDPELVKAISSSAANQLDEQIMLTMLYFNANILKTNFFKQKKSSLSFRMDPAFLKQCRSEWPTVPYGIFFVMGSDFQGFHIRFQDVARGGIRVIPSRNRHAYNKNLGSLFQENYGLANTQNKKNKDIPEFGSKGTVLLHEHAQSNSFIAFQKYVSGLLDLLILNDNNITDKYDKPELLFLGPDEGTAGYMEWAALYAKERGYEYWRSFTTGKPPSMGGIPHDTYGMTTRSVHQFVLGCLDKLGLDESQITKLQTGGPDGDLGSNEITISKDKTKAIVDGSGVVYDPNGLDRTELERLAHERVMIENFDDSKLGEGGFKVLVTDNNVTLPDGEVVDSGLAFRNDFHLHPLSSADLFVPCGGRPESVNLANVHKLFKEDGKTPRFKIICEGANLFFTQDARLMLEKAGVILYKDASTNKGGVTSSSLEVLAALCMDEATFAEHMAVVDLDNKPAFYESYCQEIQDRLEADARLEFECIWREHERTGTPRHILTDIVSDKINDLNNFMTKEIPGQPRLYENEELRRVVLEEAIPKRLQELIGLDAVIANTPANYLEAIFSCHLASRYVYENGVQSNEFAFFGFMQPRIRKAALLKK